MPINKIDKNVLVLVMMTITFCWVISLGLSVFFVFVSTGILKVLFVLLLLCEILVAILATLYFLGETDSR